MDDAVGPKTDHPQADRGPRVNERQKMSSSVPGEAAPGGAFAEAQIGRAHV